MLRDNKKKTLVMEEQVIDNKHILSKMNFTPLCSLEYIKGSLNINNENENTI